MDGAGKNFPPDPSPSRVKKSHDASIRRSEKKRNTVGRKNSQGLVRLIGQKAIDTGVFFWSLQPWDDRQPASMDLFCRGGIGGHPSRFQNPAERPRQTRIAVMTLRRKGNDVQVC